MLMEEATCNKTIPLYRSRDSVEFHLDFEGLKVKYVIVKKVNTIKKRKIYSDSIRLKEDI